MKCQLWYAIIYASVLMLLPSSHGGGVSASCDDADEKAQSDCATFDEVRVQLRWLKNGQFAGFYAAQHMLYYTEECLRVTLLTRNEASLTAPEEAALNGDAQFAIPWAIEDIELREANRTSFKTVAQVFRRPGYNQLIVHFDAPFEIDSLEQVKSLSKSLDRPVRIAASDDAHALFARLRKLGVKVCGDLLSSSAQNTTCAADDEVELFWRELSSGIPHLTAAAGSPLYADMVVGHVTGLSNILRAEDSSGELIGAENRVRTFQIQQVPLLEDGICVSEEWLAQAGNEDIARRFLRATMRGWITCRDAPLECVRALIPNNDLSHVSHDDLLFQVMEINKLIWPSASGVGSVVVEEFQEMYDYLHDSGMYQQKYDAAENLVPELMQRVIDELKAEDEDVYGQDYGRQQFQETLSFCRDGPTLVTLCNMRCNPGAEPPGTGQIYGPEQCNVCPEDTASPGGREPCRECQDGTVAPSSGTAFCVPASSTNRALIAGIACAAGLLFLLLLPGYLLWRRSNRLKAELSAMQQGLSLLDDSMDMDAPLVKALSFLEDVEQGRHNHAWQPWKQEDLQRKARELRMLLLNSTSLTKPDVEKAMLADGRYGSDIVKFVVQNTAEGEMRSYDGNLSSTSKFKGLDSSFNLSDTDTLPQGMREDFSRLGKSFSVDVLTWVRLYPKGLLGIVLARFVKGWKLHEKLSLSVSKVLRFADTIELGHQNNPYHCLAHSIDVTVRLGTILEKSGFAEFLVKSPGIQGSLTLLGAFLSAVVHDYQHAGVSNQYVINAEMDESIKFNDQSCLENQALLAALGELRAENSLISHFEKSEKQQLRSLIIKMVLATDMGKHFSVLTAVQAKVLDHYDGSKDVNARYKDLSSEQVHILLELFLKTADLGHCGLPLRSHLCWVKRIQDEFWRQGDAERARGLPLSPLADRSKPGALWGSNQVGFFKALVCPMYAMLTTVAPECHELQDGVNVNLTFWRENPGAPPAEMMLCDDNKGGDTSATGQRDGIESPLIPASPRSKALEDSQIALPGAIPGDVACPPARQAFMPKASPATLQIDGESLRLLDM